MDLLLQIISLIFVLFFLTTLGSWVVLARLSHKSQWKYPALNERFISVSMKLIGSTFLGILAIFRLTSLTIAPPWGIILLALGFMFHNLPPIIWYFFYKTGRFHASERPIKDF